MRLDLARTFGNPAYWLDPDLDPLIVETAVELVLTRKEPK